jgi:hypothetical protein
MKEFSKADIERIKLYAIGLPMIVAGIFSLIIVDDVTHFRKSALLVYLLGPQGALWFFRICIVVILLVLPLTMLFLASRHDRRYDRFVQRRYELDNSISDDQGKSG